MYRGAADVSRSFFFRTVISPASRPRSPASQPAQHASDSFLFSSLPFTDQFRLPPCPCHWLLPQLAVVRDDPDTRNGGLRRPTLRRPQKMRGMMWRCTSCVTVSWRCSLPIHTPCGPLPSAVPCAPSRRGHLQRDVLSCISDLLPFPNPFLANNTYLSHANNTPFHANNAPPFHANNAPLHVLHSFMRLTHTLSCDSRTLFHANHAHFSMRTTHTFQCEPHTFFHANHAHYFMRATHTLSCEPRTLFNANHALHANHAPPHANHAPWPANHALHANHAPPLTRTTHPHANHAPTDA
ncbi:hypothetical protein DFH06DRAFT_1213440 [Mycena polygramma]|nr:hypothetical protein DFH06DRAFT_1213440 [Mycena polygramma]